MGDQLLRVRGEVSNGFVVTIWQGTGETVARKVRDSRENKKSFTRLFIEKCVGYEGWARKWEPYKRNAGRRKET